MTSRRTRIKAVANIPARRPKATDKTEKAGFGIKEVDDNTPQLLNSVHVTFEQQTSPILGSVLQKTEKFTNEPSSFTHIGCSEMIDHDKASNIQQNISSNLVPLVELGNDVKEKEQSVSKVSVDSITSDVEGYIHSNNSVGCSKVEYNNSVHNDIAISEESSKGNVKSGNPMKFMRKRIKPSVNLPSAVVRRAISRAFNDSMAVNGYQSGSTKDVMSSNRPESVPVVSPIIPTGIAVRPQETEKSIEKMIEAMPIIFADANLPSESANLEQATDNASILSNLEPNRNYNETLSDSEKSFSQTSSEDPKDSPVDDLNNMLKKRVERTRFVKPVPRILDLKGRKTTHSSSSAEFDQNKRKPVKSHDSSKMQISDFEESGSNDEQAEEKDNEEKSKKTSKKKGFRPSICQLAKKEFYTKYSNKEPDKTVMKMHDWIFYNPTTNPMKSTTAENIKVDEVILNEEIIDEPLPEDVVEETAAMPVPQVKVGPDGQIILDEQSLVIETTGFRKNKENLAKSEAVIDMGIGSTSYGTYSKKKNRRTEWSKKDTLRFYRAMQTFGTDFSLMKTVFPKHSRNELKAKYKYEEKFNASLVKKTLLNPLDFDSTELEKELALEEEEERQAKQITASVSKAKKRKSEPRGSLGKCLDSDEWSIKKVKKKSNSKTEILRRCSGRTSKRTNKLEDYVYEDSEGFTDLNEGIEAFTVEDGFDSSKSAEDISIPHVNHIPNVVTPPVITDKDMQLSNMYSNMAPGSLLVFTTASEENPGQQVIKVFMVSNNSSKIAAATNS